MSTNGTCHLPTSLRGSTAMMTDSEIKQTDGEELVDGIDDISNDRFVAAGTFIKKLTLWRFPV